MFEDTLRGASADAQDLLSHGKWAALELLDSGDYRDNIKTDPSKEPKNPGLAKRRRDAAIELTELAEKMSVYQ